MAKFWTSTAKMRKVLSYLSFLDTWLENSFVKLRWSQPVAIGVCMTIPGYSRIWTPLILNYTWQALNTTAWIEDHAPCTWTSLPLLLLRNHMLGMGRCSRNQPRAEEIATEKLSDLDEWSVPPSQSVLQPVDGDGLPQQKWSTETDQL